MVVPAVPRHRAQTDGTQKSPDPQVKEDVTKEQEEKIRSFFNDVVNKNKVDVEEFKTVVNKAADELKTTFEGLAKQLTEAAPKLLQEVVAGATSTVTGVVKDLAPKQRAETTPKMLQEDVDGDTSAGDISAGDISTGGTSSNSN